MSIQTEMANQAPDRVLSTVINGPTWATPEEYRSIASQLAQANPLSIKGTQLMWAWSRVKDNMRLRHLNEENPERLARVMHREVVDTLRAGEDWHWAYRAVFSYDLPSAMKRIACPMFFVSGNRDQSHPRHLEAAKHFPQVPTHEYEDGGTYYIETHAEEIAPHVYDFIDGVNAGAIQSPAE